MKKNLCIISVVLFLLLMFYPSIDAAYLKFFASPEQVLHRFYTERDLGEDQLQDALILAGAKMAPLLEQEILRQDIPRRRYAIAALGNVGNSASIPVLERILRDKNELDYFRADALESIAQIELSYAQLIAPEFVSDAPPYLAKRAQVVITKPETLYRRSYEDAQRHRHD